jgi:hypothetical protein
VNTSQFIELVRDLLDDHAEVGKQPDKYTDDEILRATDVQARAAFRTFISANKDYSNFIVCPQKEKARALFRDAYQWVLPTWVSAVTGVFERDSSSGVQEDSMSPYLWGPEVRTLGIGREIPKSADQGREGWSWQGTYTLRFQQMTTPTELCVAVAKLPPRMWRAKIVDVGTDASQCYMPTSVIGDYDMEEGAVTNALVQCTDAAGYNLGVVRRVVWSRNTLNVNNTKRRIIYFEEPFPEPIAVNDILETLIPIPFEYTRYLQLLVAFACAQKRQSTLLEAIAPELLREDALFKEYAKQPRDDNGPYWRTATTERSSQVYDRNRAPRR